MTMLNLRRGPEKGKEEPRLPARQPNGAPAPQRETERQLHPAAQAAAAEYSAVWTENDFLRGDNQRLKNELSVARQIEESRERMLTDLREQLAGAIRSADERVQSIELHFRDRLAQAERAKERYLRYAVGISERLKACGDQIAEAHASAMEMANTDPLDDAERRIESEVKDLVARQPRGPVGQSGPSCPAGETASAAERA